MTTAPVQVTRGFPATFTAFYHDSLDALTDGTNVLVNIVDPHGTTVVSNSTAWTRIAAGTYEFVWDVPPAALLGTYHIVWSGVVNGDDATGSQEFEVNALNTSSSRTCGGWTDTATVRLSCSGLPATAVYSDDLLQMQIDVATDLLYTLSGAQWAGSCSQTVRPCMPNTCYNFNWAWISTGVFNPPDESSWPIGHCSCELLPQVDLGYWPVTSVTEVKINGEVVDPTTYRLDDQRYLTRVADGSGVNPGWPCHQRMDLPDTADETWSVSFEYGQAPPPAGRNAATKLACELAKADAGLACELPGRVTNAVRQGLSFTLMDPSMLDNGLTGIYVVDLFLMAYNPGKTRGTAVVYSPDLSPGSIKVG